MGGYMLSLELVNKLSWASIKVKYPSIPIFFLIFAFLVPVEGRRWLSFSLLVYWSLPTLFHRAVGFHSSLCFAGKHGSCSLWWNMRASDMFLSSVKLLTLFKVSACMQTWVSWNSHCGYFQMFPWRACFSKFNISEIVIFSVTPTWKEIILIFYNRPNKFLRKFPGSVNGLLLAPGKLSQAKLSQCPAFTCGPVREG